MTDHVFVGDFIGNQDLINLIKYPRETICFHSVIKKNRTVANVRETTFSVVDNFAMLKRHAIDVTPHVDCGTFDSYEQLCAALAEVHSQVSNSGLSQSEEGAVLTFIRRS